MDTQAHDIKVEPKETQVFEESCVVSDACSLYEDHQIKEEIVIGPIEFHKPTVEYLRTDQLVQDSETEVTQELLEESCFISEDCSLYEDHQIKEEMVIGPTEYHQPSIQYSSKHAKYPERVLSHSLEKSQEHYSTRSTQTSIDETQPLEIDSTPFKEKTTVHSPVKPVAQCGKKIVVQVSNELPVKTETEQPVKKFENTTEKNTPQTIKLFIQISKDRKQYSVTSTPKKQKYKSDKENHEKDVAQSSKSSVTQHLERAARTSKKILSDTSETQNTQPVTKVKAKSFEKTEPRFLKEDVAKASKKSALQKLQHKSDKENNSLSRNTESLQVSKYDRRPNTRKGNQITQIPEKTSFKSDNAQLSVKCYTCDYCDKSYARKLNLILHIKEHVQEDKKVEYSCEFCLKKYKYIKRYTCHLKTHNNENESKCEFCSLTFKYYGNLKRHLKQFHSKQSQTTTCTKCGKIFEKRTVYEWHRIKYHGTKDNRKSIPCTYCGKVIKSNHKRHTQLHCPNASHSVENITQLKHFICDFCNKKFLEKRFLAQHMNDHMKVSMPVPSCKICHKRFSRPYTLKKHLITHTLKHHFSCTNCKKTFKSKWGMQHHEKTCT